MTDSKLEIIHLLAHGLSNTQNAEQTATYISAINREWSALFEQDKTASDTAMSEADKENNPKSEYFTSLDQLSSLPLHTRVITPDGAGTFEGMDMMHGEAYVNLDNGELNTYVPFDVKLEPCKEDE